MVPPTQGPPAPRYQMLHHPPPSDDQSDGDDWSTGRWVNNDSPAHQGPTFTAACGAIIPADEKLWAADRYTPGEGGARGTWKEDGLWAPGRVLNEQEGRWETHPSAVEPHHQGQAHPWRRIDGGQSNRSQGGYTELAEQWANHTPWPAWVDQQPPTPQPPAPEAEKAPPPPRPWARNPQPQPPPKGGGGTKYVRLRAEPLKAAPPKRGWERSTYSTPFATQLLQGSVGKGSKINGRPIDHFKSGPPISEHARTTTGRVLVPSPKTGGEWHGACPPRKHPSPANSTTEDAAFSPKGTKQPECYAGWFCTNEKCRFEHPVGKHCEVAAMFSGCPRKKQRSSNASSKTSEGNPFGHLR